MTSHSIRIIAFSTLILAPGLFWGCAEDTKFFGDDVIAVTSDATFVSFPHPAGYASPEVHGAQALDNNGILTLGRCTQCHTVEATSDAGAPGCKNCHASYPHPVGWGNSGIHWQSLQDSGVSPREALQQQCATRCHGTDLQGGLSNVACADCHTVYPHMPSFGEADQHGPYYLASAALPQQEQCETCHRLDELEQDGAPGCQSCHAGFPHPDHWGDSSVHIQALAEAGGSLANQISQNCATSCHGVDYEGGLSGVRCMNCHANYPHPLGWNLALGHGLAVLQSPQTQWTSCQTCHGTHGEGGAFAGACLDCHDLPDSTAPVQHPPSQTMVCGSCHATSESEIQAPHLLKGNAPAICSTCHAEQLAPRTYSHSVTTSGSSCVGCHDPHNAEEPKLLRSPEPLLCLNCHDTTIQSEAYGTTRDIASIYAHATNRHAPFANEDCSTCHDVHGSNNQHLLRHNEAMFWLGPNNNPSDSSCTEAGCHDLGTYFFTGTYGAPYPVVRPSPSLPTQFVKIQGQTALNLHAYHNFAGCLACHEPHGNNDPYLLRSYIAPYTNPGTNRFWVIGDCGACHLNPPVYPAGYPNQLW